ncbi:AraC family transcriptional regulator [Gemmata massiliana]|nr:helix-turn-helix domain-containing protein [Gemmata massiliana]
MNIPNLPAFDSDRDTVHIRRKVRFVRGGLVGMSEEITVPVAHRAVMGTGPYWFFARIERDAGAIGCQRPDEVAWVPFDRFCWFLPPYSLVELRFQEFHCVSTGVFCSGPLPEGVGNEPILFEAPVDPSPETPEAIAALVVGAGKSIQISRSQTPTALGSACKNVIDRHFDSAVPLSELAQALHVCPTQFSRAFKRDYGVPPRVYRHRLRVLHAIMKLLAGDKIAQVGFDVGFGDLSRFYKQFRAITRTSPGTYVPG